MATVAIGDIHGNLPALEDLLAKLEPELEPGDEIVFLGDFIDRGPDARGCIERILSLQEKAPFSVVALMGNHEEWMLRSYRDPTHHSWILGMEAFETIASYSVESAAELRHQAMRAGARLVTERIALPYQLFFDRLPWPHRRFFETLRPYHRSPHVVCVHGGLDPAHGPVERQDVESMIWGTDDFPEGYSGADAIVYGHWNNAVLDTGGWPQPRVGGNRTFGIDTISHGVLTAIRFPDAKVYQSALFDVME